MRAARRDSIPPLCHTTDSRFAAGFDRAMRGKGTVREVDNKRDRLRWPSRVALGISLLLIAAEYLLFGCPIRLLTGICCPGCGMSRAVWALCHLDVAAALHYHPLVFLLPAALIVWIFRKKIPKRAFYILCAVAGAVFLAVYVWRLLSGSDVVYAHPEQGLIGRLFGLLGA